ncbi:MAG: HD domain-containing phosphohydrolase [Syntrophobacteraceae bacterium]
MTGSLIRRILIVDDEEGYRKVVHGLIQKISNAYSCDFAANGNDALAMIRRGRYDLVISDIVMDCGTGIELMKAAKELYPELDFIIMTGHAPEYEFSDIIDAGASDFITKPFAWGELKAKIGRIEKEQRVLRDLRESNLRLSESLDRLKWVLEDSINALASALESKDPYTAGHQQRVSDTACQIARKMELSQDQLTAVRLAGLVHDIGKISVPSEILSKPSKLSELEFELIKLHAHTGFDILKRIQFPWPIAQILLQHHERMDGSGYPQGLSGKEILLEARIIAVADVVEAMSSHRPYRSALGLQKALEEISKNRGILYDPDVVDACLKLEDYLSCRDSSQNARGPAEAARPPQ